MITAAQTSRQFTMQPRRAVSIMNLCNRDTVPGAVLFDLDDTLFDHEHAARAALLRCAPVARGLHTIAVRCIRTGARADPRGAALEVLAGERGLDDAGEERFRRLFAASGVRGDDDAVRATAAAYREAYLAARRPVDGALALLAALKPRVRIGIVSNNLLEEQQDKIAVLRLRPVRRCARRVGDGRRRQTRPGDFRARARASSVRAPRTR